MYCLRAITSHLRHAQKKFQPVKRSLQKTKCHKIPKFYSTQLEFVDESGIICL